MSTNTTSDIADLISALQGGVTSLRPETALHTIEQWEMTLAASNDEQVQAVAQDLATLRGAITLDSLDGVTIGDVLQSLGSRIQNLSGGVDVNLAAQFMELGDLLNQEGANLGGGTSSAPMTETGPEVSAGSGTMGGSITGGSTTMAGSDSAATGKNGGGI